MQEDRDLIRLKHHHFLYQAIRFLKASESFEDDVPRIATALSAQLAVDWCVRAL